MAGYSDKPAISTAAHRVGTEWRLDAVFPNGKKVAIRGFATGAEADEWLGSIKHLTWLRNNRPAFAGRASSAAFKHLSAAVFASISVASITAEAARQRWANVKRAGALIALVAIDRLDNSAPRFVSVPSKLTKQVSEAWSLAKQLALIFCCRIVHRPGRIIVGALLTLVVAMVSLGRIEQPLGS